MRVSRLSSPQGLGPLTPTASLLFIARPGEASWCGAPGVPPGGAVGIVLYLPRCYLAMCVIPDGPPRGLTTRVNLFLCVSCALRAWAAPPRAGGWPSIRATSLVVDRAMPSTLLNLAKPNRCEISHSGAGHSLICKQNNNRQNTSSFLLGPAALFTRARDVQTGLPGESEWRGHFVIFVRGSCEIFETPDFRLKLK